MTQRLLTAQLYETVLIAPAAHADTLLIVAGYASPAMVGRLLHDLNSNSHHKIRIHLVVGMVGHEGIVHQDHDGFVQLQNDNPDQLQIAYTTLGRSVHTKLYVWLNAGQPFSAWAGSANFTQNGFLVGWRRAKHSEILVDIDPSQGMAEFKRIEADSLSAVHPDVDAEIEVHSRRWFNRSFVATDDSDDSDDIAELAGARTLVLPLVALKNSKKGTVKGGVHLSWGLNWGDRAGQNYRNNKNEAVIPYPALAKETEPDFFPAGVAGNRIVFHVTTDDNKSLLMVVAEDGDKALHSLPSNGAMGEYFRSRLGVAYGAPVTTADLQKFGSRFVKFYLLDDETYHMTYSPDVEAEGVALYNV